ALAQGHGHAPVAAEVRARPEGEGKSHQTQPNSQPLLGDAGMEAPGAPDGNDRARDRMPVQVHDDDHANDDRQADPPAARPRSAPARLLIEEGADEPVENERGPEGADHRGGCPHRRAGSQSLKLLNCSGRSSFEPRSSLMASCRSSRCLPVTRTFSPWLLAWTLSFESLMRREIFFPVSASIPCLRSTCWRAAERLTSGSLASRQARSMPRLLRRNFRISSICLS